MKRAAVLLFALGAAGAGCENAMHDMYVQPKLRHQDPTTVFSDRSATQLPPIGTVACSAGVAADATSGIRGRVDWPARAESGRAVPWLVGAPASAGLPPTPTSLAELERGRQRFEIDCAPCHGVLGDGNGIVAGRGFPHPPSYHQPRLRAAPDSHYEDVIEHGYGLMFPYGDRVAPADRHAIVAYIRALQLSQFAPVAGIAPADRKALGVSP